VLLKVKELISIAKSKGINLGGSQSTKSGVAQMYAARVVVQIANSKIPRVANKLPGLHQVNKNDNPGPLVEEFQRCLIEP
jgi:hypothetical protein